MSSFDWASRETFKDVVILPDRSLPWDWKLNGNPMRHDPGIRKDDILKYMSEEELREVDELILTQGRQNRLQVGEKVREDLKEMGVKNLYVNNTNIAIEYYKEKIENQPDMKIAAFIHTTC
mmetsp:Transcript_6721/g.5987  ORF Transcript_6721/g.5987 Transcript_6721/m.5987 type:complete len:121 (+) Transcript_6721:104-466(+)|eukprot:CAMPEP_0170556038 /NCGR_PEP_ID=MMETSP0211-20121228/15262_1 /TAXON_ID=311385 /ORGANISM="Pseudokeronopsis sp., Strain OXSARD2" /LENGTH=120 /DNA_ID=CAMNT_0010866131 /DNA_START=89 /DNA_END=451 /DNA_ORIENTATION=+